MLAQGDEQTIELRIEFFGPFVGNGAIALKDKCAQSNVFFVVYSQLITQGTLDVRDAIGDFLITES